MSGTSRSKRVGVVLLRVLYAIGYSFYTAALAWRDIFYAAISFKARRRHEQDFDRAMLYVEMVLGFDQILKFRMSYEASKVSADIARAPNLTPYQDHFKFVFENGEALWCVSPKNGAAIWAAVIEAWFEYGRLRQWRFWDRGEAFRFVQRHYQQLRRTAAAAV